MNWLEITLNTAPGNVEALAAELTANGFEELVLEDQGEFESFLEENRDCWDYIDEELQQKLQGLSRIKLYLDRRTPPPMTGSAPCAPPTALPPWRAYWLSSSGSKAARRIIRPRRLATPW